MAPTTQDAPPAGAGGRVHVGDAPPPRNGVVAVPLKVTRPVGTELEAVSRTGALPAVVDCGVTLGGVHATVVVVGSIPLSTATPKGPPESLAKVSLRLAGVAMLARPIAPAELSAQYR